jgi:hypothetical protein
MRLAVRLDRSKSANPAITGRAREFLHPPCRADSNLSGEACWERQAAEKGFHFVDLEDRL